MRHLPVCAAIALSIVTPALAQETVPPTCSYGEPSSLAPEELKQFAFLIGDYRISLHAWRDGDWTPPQPGVTARWNGRYGLGGVTIVDEWYNPDPAQDPSGNRGINVRMYDEDAGEWDMMWVATSDHQVQDLRAKIIDGVLTMWQVYPERSDFRAEFHVEDEDHWSRIEHRREENGEWTPLYKLSASRIPCGD